MNRYLSRGTVTPFRVYLSLLLHGLIGSASFASSNPFLDELKAMSAANAPMTDLIRAMGQHETVWNSTENPAQNGINRAEMIRVLVDLEHQFVSVPAGKFQMGSPEAEEHRQFTEVQRWVLLKPFRVSKVLVTQMLWYLVLNENPSHFKAKKYCPQTHVEIRGVALCPSHPVEQVNWYDINDRFIPALNRHLAPNRTSVRLLSHAELERATRGKLESPYFGAPYFFGEITHLGDYAWISDNSGDQSHPVGTKASNSLGLFDMLGNVMSWTQDELELRFDVVSSPEHPILDPIDQGSDASHLVVGSSYSSIFTQCRSASHFAIHSNELAPRIGVRLGIDIQEGVH